MAFSIFDLTSSIDLQQLKLPFISAAENLEPIEN